MGKREPSRTGLCLALLLALLLAISAYGCTSKTDEPTVSEPASNDLFAKEPDKLGSWGQINQHIKRGAGWQQIVMDSPFQLGEFKLMNDPDNYAEDYGEVGYGTYPRIDGSTVAVPMAVEFIRQHLKFSDEDANEFVFFRTTHNAYVNLITKATDDSAGVGIQRDGEEYMNFMDHKHPVDLLIATEPSADELALAKRHSVELVKKPVCYDAFVFITHKDNPVESLTVDQVRDIYSGKITNWKKVGGKNMAITAYQREKNSGSQTAMINLVMQGTPMLPAERLTAVVDMDELIETVAEYKNDSASIGYSYKYYVDALYKNENIKILKINDISPDVKNLRTGSYPFTTCYYGVIRADDKARTGGLFLDWMLSEEGQRCIKQAGYIPYAEH